MTSKSKGVVGSMVVHTVILVLILLFGFSTPLPLPEEQGILINFGDDDQGMGLVEPRAAVPQPSPPPPPRPSEPAPEDLMTQDFEEAPALPPAQPALRPQPQPQPQPVRRPEQPQAEPQPAPVPQEPAVPVAERPREADRRALFPGRRDDGGTQGEGQTGAQGNQGDPQGDPESASRVGGPAGGGISFSLSGRASVSLPKPEYPSQVEGDVVVQVTVDRQGNVTKAQAGVRGSSTLDSELLRAAERAALQAKFDVSPNAPAFQTGTITYRFRLRQ